MTLPPQSTADTMAIQALVTEFAYFIDQGLPDRVADLFTVDGWYGRERGVRCSGRAAIRDAYDRRGRQNPERVCRHLFMNLRVEFNGADAATGLSTLLLVAGDGQLPLPMNITLVQDYVDAYAKVDGLWLFASRETRRLFVGSGFREVLQLGTKR